jgi:carbonic anhydrase
VSPGVVKDIPPAVLKVQHLPEEEQVAAAVEENVRQTVHELQWIPGVAKAEKEGRLLVVGAVYDLETGRVRLLGKR